jgi:general secretion pathway protein M
MNAEHALNRYLARYPYVAVAAYVVLVVALVATTWLTAASLLDESAALTGSRDILRQLEARPQGADTTAGPGGAVPAGSPFLGGETVTVAGAALLQRVAGAITRFGGTVQSSQVDLQGSQAKDGFVTLTISCEMDQPNMQKFLYDLESGMPFLYVDQLVVQGPQLSNAPGGSQMRILVSVSGQWKSNK